MVYAVALALHKNRNPQASAGSMMATVTTVKSNDSGQIERDNHPDRTWSMEFHKDSEGEYDKKLRRAIYKFLGTVAEVAKLHKESGTDYALPVIWGLEDSEFNPSTLADYLKTNLSEIFGKLVGSTVPYFEQSLISSFYSYSIFQNVETYLFPRYYINNKQNNGQTANQNSENVEEYLEKLFKLALDGNSLAIKELNTIVREHGEYYGSQRALIRRSRFVSPGVRNQNGENIFSQILKELNLKEVFTKALKQAAGIEHNICVKLEGDERRRPFEDVAMTYVQDMLDSIPVEDW